jgi:hypothetical protein
MPWCTVAAANLRGKMIWEPQRVGLRLTFEDQGPGIVDLGLAMTPGWTSGPGIGLGLSGAKRLVDDFFIESNLGKGTRVVIPHWRKGSHPICFLRSTPHPLESLLLANIP